MAVSTLTGKGQTTPDDVRAAIGDYRNGADFADALIAACNVRLGCQYTATFDRRAVGRTGFK